MRSGRRRSEDKVRQRGDAILGAHRDEVRRTALQFAGVLDQHHAVARAGDLGQERVGERRLARAGAASDEDVLARGDGPTQQRRLTGGHGASVDIIVEGEDGDCGLADGEGRRRDDGRQQPLEPLSRLGQLGRDTRALRVNLSADMVRDKAHDPLAIGGRQCPTAILKAAGEPIDPEPAIGIQHHLDDRRVFEKGGDGRAERGAQHARTA
jgi:hypothetical protein